MAAANEKRPGGGAETTPPTGRGRGAVTWSAETEVDPWHADSSLPAAETLSDLPEPAELLEEIPEEVEDDLDEEASPVEAAEDADEGGSGKNEGRRRSKTIARKQMLRERRRLLAQGILPEVMDYDRPGTRATCREAKRPCLYVSCRYHLYLDVNPITGSIKINFPDKEVWELEETCALDVAERGGITLEEVGEIMNLTRERIRQVEVNGLDKLRDGEVSLETFLDGHELEIGGPSATGRARLPILDD